VNAYKLLAFFVLLLVMQRTKAQLVADFSADRVSGCAPILVSFSDKSTGTNASTTYRWDLGNGTIAVNTTTPSAVYLTPGTYTVKLTIANGNDSATVVKTNFLTIYGVPTVSFGGSPMFGCLPVQVQFKDSSTAGSGNITSLKWDFGDGFLGTGANPTHTYNTAGNFKVTLIAENSHGCVNSNSKLNYISVLDSIHANFTLVEPAVCAVPATFRFTSTSTGNNITRYSWDFGDGGSSTQRNPSHTYTVSGTYTVRLAIQNAAGCTDTIVKVSVVNAGNYNADFTVPSVACVGKPVPLINTSSPANLLESSYWTLGNGSSASSINAIAIYNTTGTYSIKLVSKIGRCTDSIVKNITVVPRSKADFSASPRGACKPPLTVQFNNMSVDGTVVKWYFGNGDSSTATNPTITYNNYGSYSVRLIVVNPSGCTDTLVRPNYINIQQPDAVRILGLPHQGCLPWTGTFDVESNAPDGVVKYEWDFGDGTTGEGKGAQHTYTNEGIYTVIGKITTSGGCVDTVSGIVQGGAKPKAGFSATPRPIVCPSDDVSFTSLSTGVIDKWEWQFGDGGSSGAEHPSYRYNDTGWMSVQLIVSNKGCGDTLVYDDYMYVNPPISLFKDSFVCGNQFTRFFTEEAIGAKYWKWFIDEKDSIVQQNLVYTFADTGLHKVRLYVTDSICWHNNTQDVLVLDEKAAFITTDSGNCRNTFVKFNVSTAKSHYWNIKEYKWDFGDSTGLITTDTSVIVHDYKSAGLKQIKLIITDINDCVDSSITPLNVRLYGPKANFGPAYSAICANNPAIFSDSTSISPGSPIIKWMWNFGLGTDTTFTAPPFSYKYKQAGTYDIRLIVEDSLGCRDTLSRPKSVAVYKPVAAFESPDTLICVNAPAKFVNLSEGRQLRYAWSFGDGKTSRALTPNNRYIEAGYYDVKLVVTDSLSCTDSILRPKYIHVGDAVADFVVSDSFTTCPPLLVEFTNKSQNFISTTWDFANGNTSSLKSPAHTYTTPGSFNVKLKVLGNGGCADSAYKRIVIQGPSGSFTYGPLFGCAPLKLDFVSKTINTKSYTWDFSDGETSVTSDSVTSHIYRIPGTFVPRMILSDDKGCQLPIQGPDTLRVTGAAAFIQSLPNYNFCDSVTVSFFDSTITSDVVTSYKWSFGDGSQTSERNPVHSYKKPGTYIVTFEVRTLGGCVSIDTIKQPIIVAPTPKIAIGSDSAVCVPNTVQFNGIWQNRDTSILIYNWTFGNNTSSNLLRPRPVEYARPGKFDIALIATNIYGCADTASKLLTVNDTPRVVAKPDSYICLGKSVTLSATGAATYRWDNNSSLNCVNCASPIAKPTTQQLYKVTGTDSNGCRSSNTVFVNVKPPASIIAQPGDTLCVGESFQLGSAGTELYKWEPSTGLSNPNIANPIARPQATTRYMVVGYDSLGCFYDTSYVQMIVYPIPQFNILEARIEAPTGTLVTIKTQSSDDITNWRWFPPTGLSCINCTEPQHIISRPEIYTATVTNDGGCSAKDQVTIVPICNSENVFIPNTFSPNGDGHNDLFYPRGKGLAAIKAMRIFNRWGELLFEQKDFAVNDASSGWDGTYKGVKLSADVYVYMIDVLCENNVVFNLKGNITLLK
jgi:gliding motility-associated-like protein